MKAAYMLSTVVAVFALTGLGIFVFERQRRTTNRLLGGFLLSVSGYLLSDFVNYWIRTLPTSPISELNIYGARMWMQLANVLSIFFASIFPALLLHFCMEFPRPKWLARTRYVPLVYVPGLALMPFLYASGLSPFPHRPAYHPAPILVIWQTWLLLYLAIALVALATSYRAASSGIERQQLLLMLVGLGVPLIALPVGWQVRNWVSSGWASATWILTAVILTYSIARYRLFDTRVVIRRALAYSLITALVTVAYVFVVLAANLLTAGMPPTTVRILNAVLIVAIAVLLVPTKERIQSAVDRIFLKGETGRQQWLTTLGQELRTALVPQTVADLTVQRLTEALDATHAYLALQDGEEFKVSAHCGEASAEGLSQRFHQSEDLMRWFVRYQEPATVEQMTADTRFGTTYVRSWTRLDAMKAALCAPLLSGDGALLGVVFLGARHSGKAYDREDILFSHVVCNQAAIALENAQLHQRASEEERLATLGRMASTIMHDLRSPISGMMKCVEALGEEDLPPDVRERLARAALEMMGRLYRLPQQVLDYARGNLFLDLQPVSVQDFIDGLLPVMEADLQGHGVHVATDIQYQGALRIDRDRMAQVAYNLVTNARDAMPNGGTLTIRVEASDGGVRMSFADTGVGIPADRLEKIFEPFVSYKGEQGAGLGLAICRKVVKEHGGSLEVTSEVGVGSTFVVSLPVE
jgi:two-component system sensor histidine kinase HydH